MTLTQSLGTDQPTSLKRTRIYPASSGATRLLSTCRFSGRCGQNVTKLHSTVNSNRSVWNSLVYRTTPRMLDIHIFRGASLFPDVSASAWDHASEGIPDRSNQYCCSCIQLYFLISNFMIKKVLIASIPSPPQIGYDIRHSKISRFSFPNR